MTLDSFPDREPGDDAEPDGFPLPPGAEEDGLEGFDAGLGQGLYVCLPAEQLTLAGFAQNGEADTMAPGPLLGTVVHAVVGEDGKELAGCSDDQLMGIISAARRQEARDAWTLMTAMAEFTARHAAGTVEDGFAADELAAGLHLTPLSAAGQMAYATADRILAAAAPGLTFGELRAAARTLILQLDPEAAKIRKEAARADAHVRPFRETSGNAGMVARELPSDEVLASWQHVEQRARDLRAAGIAGSLRELRVRAYLDLLQERDSRTQPATPDPAPGPDSASDLAPHASSDSVPDNPDPTSSAPDPDSASDQQPADGDPPGTDPDAPATAPVARVPVPLLALLQAPGPRAPCPC